MRIEVNGEQWQRQAQEMAEALGGMEAAGTRKATERAVRKTARWLQTRLARNVAHNLGLPVGRLKKARVSVRMGNKDASAEVWMGTRPFPANRIGKVRWTRRMRGARAGRRQFPRAFAYGTNPENPVILRRRKATAPDGTVDVHVGEELAKVAMPINEAAEEAVRRLERRAAQRFQQVLRQELNYEMSKRFG